ncbi:MAG TPA: glutamate--tRNA ligase family protein, partial [Solirubrobacteraceae bacterium]
GYPVPEMAHVSMILGADRHRLSKRHGATSVQAFRDAGILADAMVNYLARLGWSHGDQEIFTREELIQLFDIKDVAASGAVFDEAKLEWLNQESMKRTDDGRLAELVMPFVARAGLPVPADRAWLARVVATLKERAKTLIELVEVGRFYFEAPARYDDKAAARFFTAVGADRLSRLMARLAEIEFRPPALEAAYRELAAALEVKLVDLAQLSRLAVTGGTASPPIFDVLAILGREETLARMRRARAAIP